MIADDVGVVDHVVAAPIVRRDDTDAGQALGQVGQHVGDAIAHEPVGRVGLLRGTSC